MTRAEEIKGYDLDKMADFLCDITGSGCSEPGDVCAFQEYIKDATFPYGCGAINYLIREVENNELSGIFVTGAKDA